MPFKDCSNVYPSSVSRMNVTRTTCLVPRVCMRLVLFSLGYLFVLVAWNTDQLCYLYIFKQWQWVGGSHCLWPPKRQEVYRLFQTGKIFDSSQLCMIPNAEISLYNEITGPEKREELLFYTHMSYTVIYYWLHHNYYAKPWKLGIYALKP